MTNIKQKLFIKTWGCQMNVYDSARMADVLIPLGYERTENQEEANLIILNTCHIREKASEKLFSELGRLHAIQRKKEASGHKIMIAVAGCVAQAVGIEIKKRAPYVEMIFGPQTYHELPKMLAKAARDGKCVLNTEFPAEPKFDYLPKEQTQEGVTAFLSVQEGCDRFCSYCVVPYTRGVEYSRPFSSIIDEAKILADKGIKEINLLGQNVNAYIDEETGKKLSDVIKSIADIKDILRIRYTTSYPSDMSDDLIDVHKNVSKLMPYLHLPIQSGSDSVLKGMNRRHTADDYRHIIDKLMKAQPDMALSSDFIVGFPGETDKDFEDTINVVKEITYVQAFSFKYSRRIGTPAASMKKQVAEDVKEKRLEILQKLLRQQQTDFNEASVDKIMPVLFETYHENKGHVFGRTPYMQAVRVKGDASLVGKEYNVKITKSFPNSLVGDLID